MQSNIERLHCLNKDAVDTKLDFRCPIGCLDMNVAGAALHRAQQNGIEQLDGRTLVFSGMIDGEDLLASFVLLHQHRPVLRFKLSQRLIGPCATVQRRKNGAL